MKSIVKLLFGATVLLGLSSCVNIAPGGQGYNITVPMHMINSTVGQNFPQSQKTDYGTLVMQKPNILGQQGTNKLAVGTDFTFFNALIPNGIKGAISFSSGVRYNVRDRGLYLTSPMVDDIRLHSFALSTYMTPQMRNFIAEIITQQLSNKPIYRINTMGASLVKGIRVEHGNVVVQVGL